MAISKWSPFHEMNRFFDRTKATYKDGVLKVVMPLKKGAEQKKIEIKRD